MICEVSVFMLAAGDINGDGAPEIVVAPWGTAGNTEVRAYNAQLEVIWRRTLPGATATVGPSIADIDQDGQAEVILHGGTVLNGADGRVIQRPDRATEYGVGVFVADLDQDGDQEIIASNFIYDTDGSDITPSSIRALSQGPVALGELHESPGPELILISQRELRVFSTDGALLFGPHPLSEQPTPFLGGLPTVGDFDGDGEAEIGIAGQNTYTVFDPGCVEPLPESCEAPGILWRVATHDIWTTRGGALFDFDGDGSLELVFNDTCFLRIYEAATGSVHAAVGNTLHGATSGEAPLVADVDGDGTSEIIMSSGTSRGCWDEGGEVDTRGVVIIEAAGTPWMGSRPIWNQHNYHINNINDDGTLPEPAVRNQSPTSWRQQRTTGDPRCF